MSAKPHSPLQVFSYRVRLAFDALRGSSERDAPPKWALEEDRVRRKLRPQLTQYLELANDVEDLSFNIISSLKNLRQSPHVFEAHTTLATRALHDLRVAVSASLAGYTLQGWAIAASGFEAAHMAGFIGTNTDRAKRWLEHEDMARSLTTVYDSVVGTFKYLGLGTTDEERNSLVQNEYDLYKYLCMAKHVNPIAERHRYWIEEPGSTRLMFTPFYVPRLVGEAKLGLGLASRAGLQGCWIVALAHAEHFSFYEPALVALAGRTAAGIRGWRNTAEKD